MGVGGPGIGNQFISRVGYEGSLGGIGGSSYGGMGGGIGGMLGGLGGIGGGYNGGMGGMGIGGGLRYFYSYRGCPGGSIWIRRINKNNVVMCIVETKQETWWRILLI